MTKLNIMKKSIAVAVCCLTIGAATLPAFENSFMNSASITASAAISTSSNLKVGSRGTQVKYLQMNLNVLNYNAGSADGIFGNGTKNAVIRFQRAYGLSADGIAGKNTINKMNSVATQLQKDLNSLGYNCGTADGILGNNTVNAIKKFQRAYGLSADGIAGPQTMSKINSVKNQPSGKTNSSSNTSSSNSSARNKIVNIALSEYNKHVSGMDNKYTRWYGKIGSSYSYSWCAAFVSYCANQAGVLNKSIPKYSGCRNGYNWFNSRKLAKSYSSSSNIRPGDIVFVCTCNGKDGMGKKCIDHTGIVVSVSGSTITTVEGNTGRPGYSGRWVEKKTYNKSTGRRTSDYCFISYFASPNY